MLTEWALRERKWGSFPAMRQVLEGAPATDRHCGFTSVSDNVFAEQRRLVEIANQAEEHRGALLDAVHQTPELRAQMLEDLHHLQKRLDALRHAFAHEIKSVQALCEEVHGLNR